MATTSFFSTTGIAGNAAAGNINHDYYLGASASAPTTGLNGETLATGMLYTKLSDSLLYYYDGTTWIEASSAGNALENVVEDLTPELGGDLQSNGHDVVMAADDIVQLGTDATLSTLILHASAQNTSRVQSASFHFMDRSGSNLTASITPGATKTVSLFWQGAEKMAVNAGGIVVTGAMTSDTATIASLSYPTADGTSGQVVTTDGAGNLTLQDAGGASVGSAIAFAIAL